MIKALILDCGGVIMYPASGHWLLPADAREILGGELPDFDRHKIAAALKKCLPIIDEGQLVTTKQHEYELQLAFMRAMNAELDAGLSDAQCAALARSETYEVDRSLIYDDVLPYLNKWAAEYKLCILSNAMPSIFDVLRENGVYDKLYSCIISTSQGCRKPDSEIFRRFLSEIRLAPDECLFADDLKANLAEAKRMGMKTVRVKRESYTMLQTEEFEWESCVKDMEELDKLLTRLSQCDAPKH